jgi:hypothetical protein
MKKSINVINKKMKKLIIVAYLMILSLSAVNAAAVNPENNRSDKTADKNKNEYKLSDEEAMRLRNRVEEIRNMDKSKLTAKEKRDLRKELKSIKKRDVEYVYISGGTLLIIVLIILLI